MKIRDDQGYWTQFENYISSHSQAEFSHSICPECVRKLYQEYHNAKQYAAEKGKIVRTAIQYTIFIMLFLLIFGTSYPILADDDHHKGRNRYQKGSQKHGDDNDDHDNVTYLKPVTNQTYKETCGACHIAYQPGLLPSFSWVLILNKLENHFGEAVSIDAESKKTISKYLMDNAADHSNAKQAVKIMKSLRGQTPSRITEIPYIRHKHHDIPPEVFSRKTVGSFSNCSACHRAAEQGIYDDDRVVIPK